MGRVGLLGLLGLLGLGGGVGKKTLANFQSLPKCVAHYCSVILRHILGCASSVRAAQAFILRSRFAHPSLILRWTFAEKNYEFWIGHKLQACASGVLTPVPPPQKGGGQCAVVLCGGIMNFELKGVRKVLFCEGELPFAPTMWIKTRDYQSLWRNHTFKTFE